MTRDSDRPMSCPPTTHRQTESVIVRVEHRDGRRVDTLRAVCWTCGAKWTDQVTR